MPVRIRGEEEPALGFRFEMALLYAFRLHGEQRRKGGDIPYIAHLLGVAALVIEAGGDEDQAIAALLHDATEDQGGEDVARDIGELFGPRVLGIVRACSDESPEFPVHTRENSWARKEWYLQHLETMPEEALVVTLADKLYNARSIVADLRIVGPSIWDRFNVGEAKQLDYYHRLVEVLLRRTQEAQGARLAFLAQELRRTVEEMQRASAGGSS